MLSITKRLVAGNFLMVRIFPVVSSYLLLALFLNNEAYAQSSTQVTLSNAEVSLRNLFNNPTTFTRKDGFPLSSTSAMIKDDQGFIWIGGQGGLVRFDGSKFTQISLCGEGTEQWWVRDLFFDLDRQMLWIATWGYGLLQLDMKTYHCTTIYTGSRYEDKYLYWVHRESDALWVGKSQGMSALPFDQDTVLNFNYKPKLAEDDQNSLEPANKFLCYYRDVNNDSLLWIGTVSGLLKFNVKSHRFNRYYYDYGAGENNALNSIPALYQHQDGRLFLGTWGAGIVRFDPVTSLFERPSTRFPDNRHRVVNRIIPHGENILWLSTGDGIEELDPINLHIRADLHNNPDEELIYRFHFIDEAGRMFYGYQNQFFVIDPLSQQFSSYPMGQLPFPNNRTAIKGVLKTDNENTFWLLLYGDRGIYKYETNTGKWSMVYFPRPTPFPLISYARLRNGHYVLVGHDTVYYDFDPAIGQVHTGKIWPDPELIVNGFLEHSDGSYWFSTQTHGLIKWQDGKPVRYLDELQHPSLADHHLALGSMTEDSLGNLWINSTTGYSVYDYRRDSFFNFPYPLGDTTDRVDLVSIVQDKKGGIWLISFRHGIMQVDPEHPDRGVKYPINELKYPVSSSGPVDRSGKIWLHSEAGLEWFDPEKHKSGFFTHSYGVPEKISAFKILEDGRLCLAYPGGFKLFHSDSLMLNHFYPTPYISGFTVFDQTLDSVGPFHSLERISLSPQQNFFSIQFSGINYSFPQLDSFAYQLEDIDPHWIVTKNRREVYYTNVPSGNYTFKLKSANSEGVWNPNPHILSIHIATPWWKTRWAIFVYFLASVWLVFVLYRFQLSRKLALAESERLQELNAWKAQFYTNITHEFRTPLTVILGMTDTIKKAITTGNVPKSMQASDRIRHNGERLLKMVNEMLDLAKLEHGNLEVQMVQLDVIPFVKYLAESFHSQVQAKQIEYHVHATPDVLMMDVDREKLTIILSNLITNAIKFTPDNGAIDVHFGTESIAGLPFFTMNVCDTGQGLSAADREAVFERFYQVAKIEEAIPGGTGIGLAFTRELVQLLDGHIGVDTRMGQGCTFWVRLPIVRKALIFKPEPAPGQISLSISSPSQSLDFAVQQADNQPEILIIEDSVDVGEYLRDCLEENYYIRYAPNGKKGIELAFEHIPDLIISDVMMPDLDGFAVCEQLKNDNRTNHIPIILLTARVTTRDKVEGISRGADVYLTKPFDKEELLARLTQLLHLRATLQQKYGGALLGNHPKGFRAEDPIDGFVVKAEQIVLSHLSEEDFSGDDLAKLLFLSPSQAYRKIKALTGMSTAVYIRHLRLRQAEVLLKDNQLTISEIAYCTGFRSPVYFSQVFKLAYGESPTAFRVKRQE